MIGFMMQFPAADHSVAMRPQKSRAETGILRYGGAIRTGLPHDWLQTTGMTRRRIMYYMQRQSAAALIGSGRMPSGVDPGRTTGRRCFVNTNSARAHILTDPAGGRQRTVAAAAWSGAAEPYPFHCAMAASPVTGSGGSADGPARQGKGRSYRARDMARAGLCWVWPKGNGPGVAASRSALAGAPQISGWWCRRARRHRTSGVTLSRARASRTASAMSVSERLRARPSMNCSA